MPICIVLQVCFLKAHAVHAYDLQTLMSGSTRQYEATTTSRSCDGVSLSTMVQCPVHGSPRDSHVLSSGAPLLLERSAQSRALSGTGRSYD